MKHTEQLWMHISTGLLVERGRKPDNSANDYRPVTVTWDEPEWEDVEVEAHALSPDYVEFADADGRRKTIPTDAKLTVRFRRPKPEPEVREQYVCEATDDVPYAAAIPAPKEWIGKRVRVEVIP